MWLIFLLKLGKKNLASKFLRLCSILDKDGKKKEGRGSVCGDLFNDLCRGVSVGWYWHIHNLAASFGMVLDHYIRPVRWQLSIRMYLHVPSKGWKLLHFQWPSQACVCTTSPVLLFYFLMLTLLLMDICSGKFGTSRYNMICLFFMLVTYPA